MSLWQSFLNLQPRTRIYIGIGVMVYSGFGLLLANKAGEKFGMVPTEQHREELKRALPKIRSIDVNGQ
ncbi:MAG: hypothetical protein Q9213_006452 [Squamulea squamosa]